MGSFDNPLSELRQIAYEMYRQVYVYQTAQQKAAGENVSGNVYGSRTMWYSGEKLISIKWANGNFGKKMFIRLSTEAFDFFSKPNTYGSTRKE